MSDEESFGSARWRPQFRELAFNYLKYATGTSGGAHVRFAQESLDRAFEWYDKAVMEYKKNTEGENYADTRIDHHKIIAFYILAVLHTRPFSYDPPSIEKGQTDRSWFSMLPNEYYCLCMMELILFGWYGTRTEIVRLDDNYKRCLIILFHRILRSGKVCDPIPLAHIVYFIEKCFFK